MTRPPVLIFLLQIYCCTLLANSSTSSSEASISNYFYPGNIQPFSNTLIEDSKVKSGAFVNVDVSRTDYTVIDLSMYILP